MLIPGSHINSPSSLYREYRRAGVTLELLHLEYLEAHPDGYGYTTFCDRYRAWLKHRGLSMRQTHHAGDKAKAEVAVQIAQRWILARLRDETFFFPWGTQSAHRRARDWPQLSPNEEARGRESP